MRCRRGASSLRRWLAPHSRAKATMVGLGLGLGYLESAGAMLAIFIVACSSFLGRNCSHEFASCMDTRCCSNPGFGCYKKTTKHWAQCLRHKPDCKDTAEWLCPGWESCSGPFEDCRQSLCCQEAGYACFRRPHLYWAQCRPAVQVEDQDGMCKDTPEWLCPGWEKCAAPYAECTKSRCCAETGYGCFLNETLLQMGGGWHAFCQPHAANMNMSMTNDSSLKGLFNVLSSVQSASVALERPHCVSHHTLCPRWSLRQGLLVDSHLLSPEAVQAEQSW